METVDMPNSISSDSVQDLGSIDDVKSEMKTDYFKNLETNEFELISKDIPQADHTKISLLNSFYNTLCLAARIPEFSETANGILVLFTQGYMTRTTWENIMIAIASAISLNPAFAWWLLVNGGVTASATLILVLEFSIMNPTKMIVLYGFSRKLPSLIKLYNYMGGESVVV